MPSPDANFVPPSPTSYSPRLTASGREWDLHQLNGAELMQSSSFAASTPARALPQDWGTIAQRLVATPDKASRAWPGPASYNSKHHSKFHGPSTVFATIPVAGREVVVPGTTVQSGILGPGHYENGHATVDSTVGTTATLKRNSARDFARKSAQLRHEFGNHWAILNRTVSVAARSELRPHTSNGGRRPFALQSPPALVRSTTAPTLAPW